MTSSIWQTTAFAGEFLDAFVENTELKNYEPDKLKLNYAKKLLESCY